MPRGPADRPCRKVDEEAALQVAMRRALELGAAPATAATPVADPPTFGTQVAQTAPIRGSSGVARSRGARSIVLPRRVRRKETAPPERPADPRGRGGTVDVRV